MSAQHLTQEIIDGIWHVFRECETAQAKYEETGKRSDHTAWKRRGGVLEVVCVGHMRKTLEEVERLKTQHADLIELLESANTLLTKAVGDIVAYRIMVNKRPDPSATAEYVEAINAIDAVLAKVGVA